jgi:hypothetical protein
MIRFLSILVLAGLPALADETVRIISPAEGSVVVGESLIEVASDLASIDRVEIRVDGRIAGVLREPPFVLPYDFGSAATPRRIEVTVFGSNYAESARASVTTASLEDAMTVDWVEVPIALSGRRPPRIEDLRITEDGVEQSIRELKADRGPARFVFVVDRSLSMAGKPIEAALAAIAAAQARLRPGDTSEILLFNHRVARPVALEDVEPEASGGTALRDALASIRPVGRTIAIVISDGDDRNSFLPAREALEAVAVSDLTVHALAFGGGVGASFLRDVAERTGGSFRRSSPDRVAGDLGAAFDELDARWIAAYQSASTSQGWRSIRVEARDRGARVLSARRGYFAE